MDPRHESLERETLNQLIIIINKYVEENIDSIINSDLIYNDIKNISKAIYDFIGVNVDVESILSKHNLLSIDVVLFPHLNDIIESKFHRSADFNQLIHTIKSITIQHGDGISELNQHINNLLNTDVLKQR